MVVLDLLLKDKKVLITASSSGIGRAIAETFLNEGAFVLLNGVNEEKLVNASQELRSKFGTERVYCYQGDMTDVQKISGLKNYVDETLKEIDILIPNLGSGKPFSEDSLELSEWERFLNINLLSAVNLVHEFLPEMIAKKDGSIIFVSSVAGIERIQAPYGYSAAKAGIISLAKNLAEKYGPYNIRVNCIVPGNIYFDGGRWEQLLAESPQLETDYIKKEVPLGRFGKPEEIAHSVVFLASKRSSFTTGAILILDGGQTRSY